MERSDVLEGDGKWCVSIQELKAIGGALEAACVDSR